METTRFTHEVFRAVARTAFMTVATKSKLKLGWWSRDIYRLEALQKVLLLPKR